MSNIGEKEIVFVTGNAGKLSEVQSYLDGIPNLRLRAVALDLPELQESTAAEISRLKAIEGYRRVNNASTPNAPLPVKGTAVLVDDTSLEFNALGGLPGPYIKWFLKTLGCEGLIKMTEGFRQPGDANNTHRLAVASCVFSYCYGADPSSGEARVVQFIGECPGRIVDAARGAKGFGWDAIFAPEECIPASGEEPFARTFAEMEVSEKNIISHRAKALQLMRAYMEKGE